MPKSPVNNDIEKIALIANDLREEVVKMLLEAGSGHPAGALGMADIFAASAIPAA